MTFFWLAAFCGVIVSGTYDSDSHLATLQAQWDAACDTLQPGSYCNSGVCHGVFEESGAPVLCIVALETIRVKELDTACSSMQRGSFCENYDPNTGEGVCRGIVDDAGSPMPCQLAEILNKIRASCANAPTKTNVFVNRMKVATLVGVALVGGYYFIPEFRRIVNHFGETVSTEGFIAAMTKVGMRGAAIARMTVTMSFRILKDIAVHMRTSTIKFATDTRDEFNSVASAISGASKPKITLSDFNYDNYAKVVVGVRKYVSKLPSYTRKIAGYTIY